MKNRGVKWLYGELPELVSKGVISAETAEELRRYYGEVKGREWRQIALMVCGILGALFTGLGIILLLAHNWSEIPRPMRTFLSLVPLISAQTLAGWVIWSQKESVAWREGAATFLMLVIGSSIALINQTYHMPTELGNFLLMWMLLGVPLVYLMHASLPAVLYLVGITVWAGFRRGGNALFLWPLASLVIPHLWMEMRKNKYAIRPVLLSWVISLCLCVAVGITLKGGPTGLWIVTYAGLFAALYLAGGLWFGEAPTIWQRPFHSLGTVGVPVLSFILSFRMFWKSFRFEPFVRHYPAMPSYLSSYLLTSAFLIAALWFLVICAVRRQTGRLLFGAVPILTLIGLLTFKAYIVPTILFNVYLLLLGVSTMILGIRDGRLSTLNAGMVILAMLIIARFFDSGLGFLARGVSFIIVGAGFLTTNLVILWGRRGGAR